MTEASSPRRHVSDVIYQAAARAASSKTVESHMDNLPALSLYAFVSSLMTVGTRIIALGRFELGIAEILSWRRPAMTFSLLILYTQLCYKPQWVVLLPLFYFITMVLVPNYAIKFKLTSADFEEDIHRGVGTITGSTEKRYLKAASNTLSSPVSPSEQQKRDRSLLDAIRKGQKQLSDLVKLLDKVDEFSNGPVKFADTQLSCLMLVACTILLGVSAFIIQFVSIPFFFSIMVWSIVLRKHPLVGKLQDKIETRLPQSCVGSTDVSRQLSEFSKRHILVDDKPIVRTVQVFELQPRGLTARQWLNESAIFSTDSYMLGSDERSQKQRPQGVSDVKDVLPPLKYIFDIDDEWIVDDDAACWTELLMTDTQRVIPSQVDGCWVYDDNIDAESVHWRRRRLTRKCYYIFN